MVLTGYCSSVVFEENLWLGFRRFTHAENSIRISFVGEPHAGGKKETLAPKPSSHPAPCHGRAAGRGEQRMRNHLLTQTAEGAETTHLYFANVKVPVETLALKDINVDLGHSLKDFDSIRKKKKKKTVTDIILL